MAKKRDNPKHRDGQEVGKPKQPTPTSAEINRRNDEFWEQASRKFDERITRRPDDAEIAARRLARYAFTDQNIPETMESLVAMMAESHDKKHLAASAKGGREGGKARETRAKGWQVTVEEKARKLLAQGVSERELAGRLAQTVDASADRIRRHLKKAGLK